MNRFHIAGALALSLLCACAESSDVPASDSTPSVTNLGLATNRALLVGNGDLALFAAQESAGRDLNVDGDVLDLVVHVQDLRTGSVRNSGLALDERTAAPVLAVSRDAAIFAASESESGRRDLNGDGDATDAVLHVVDAADGTIRSLGLALPIEVGPAPSVDGTLVAFTVSESAQGRDLDGDGLRSSNVLHLYDVVTQTTKNTGLDLGRSPVFAGGGRVGFFSAESSVDLNGDGDLLDAVFQVFDPRDGSVTNSGLATAGFRPLVAGNNWLLLVPESAQGLDLNGDGDVFDLVAHVFDARVGLGGTLGLATDPSSVLVSGAAAGRQRFGVLAFEDGVDLDGDGDGFDRVAFLYDPLDRRLGIGGRAALRIDFVGAKLAFLASEPAQGASGTDLNGDGDAFDAVAFLIDPVALRTTNLQLDAVDLVGGDELLLLLRAESDTGVDSNSDGDLTDLVVQAFDPAKKTTIDTGIAAAAALGATRDVILVLADEAGQRLDLDGDGDRADLVFAVHDRKRDRTTSLNLASSDDRFAELGRDGAIVLLANELAQGRDLDGDRDLFDEVLHRVVPR